MLIPRRQFLGSALGAAAAARAAAPQPNLLLVISDQQHWRACGFEDPFFRTPAMDAFAREATVFENSFCSTPQCSPSRSSIFTGLYPTTTRVRGNVGMTGGEPLRLSTFAPALRQAGYQTAYFGKWHLGDEPAARAGWQEFDKRQDDEITTRNALEFLRGRKDSTQPFALVVCYNNPHDVYEYRPGAAKPDPATPLPASCHPGALSAKPAPQLRFLTGDQGRRIHGQPADEFRVYREVYREKVRLYDEGLAQVLGALEESGHKNRTLAVVTSDHGDMDAHHGLIWKGPFMYEQMVRVPLMIRGPGIAARREAHHHAVNIDLTPTLLDYAGAPAARIHGVSLRPLLEGSRKFRHRRTVFAEYHGKQKWTEPIRMVRTEEWKYTRYRGGGFEELYDLRSDPGEQFNLAGSPAAQNRRRALRSQLERWMKAHNDDFLNSHS